MILKYGNDNVLTFRCETPLTNFVQFGTQKKDFMSFINDGRLNFNGS